jgi:hypothetical protein
MNKAKQPADLAGCFAFRNLSVSAELNESGTFFRETLPAVNSRLPCR